MKDKDAERKRAHRLCLWLFPVFFSLSSFYILFYLHLLMLSAFFFDSLHFQALFPPPLFLSQLLLFYLVGPVCCREQFLDFFNDFQSFRENPDFQLVICRIISGFQATCFSRYELNKWFSPDFVSRIISGFKISRSYALAYRGLTLLQVSQSSQVSSSHSLPSSSSSLFRLIASYFLFYSLIASHKVVAFTFFGVRLRLFMERILIFCKKSI